MTSADRGARATVVAAAALLEQGRRVDALSRPLTVAALIALVLLPRLAVKTSAALLAVTSLVALCGIVEIYLAMRVDFDRALFRQLASDEDAADPELLDTALLALGLLPRAKAGRSLAARIDGTRRLFRHQILTAAGQLALMLVAFALTVSGS